MSIRTLLRPATVPAALFLLGASSVAAVAAAGEPTTAPAPSGPSVSASPAPAAADAKPDFSGQWRLDPKASDDPARMGAGRGFGSPGARPGDGSGRGRGGGGRGAGSGLGRGAAADPGRGGMPGDDFDGTDKADREQDEAAGRQAAREFGMMDIFHSDNEFDLTDGMQISRMLHIGGEPTEVFTPRGAVKAAAAWDGTTLVVTERDPQGQVRRTRQFMLGAGRNTLTVKEIRHLPGKDGDVVMTMVYRRAEAGVEP